ncbi:MAG: AIR synthase-related protein, partial [Bilophila sp.]
SIVFDERYLGKPLVYCGTVGLLPREVPGSVSTGPAPRKGYEKKALVGDIIVMTGGRIGKDGIHGATFSSEELHEGSPATAVQIGDPITQRKMYDFIMRARDLGLYNAITDNGAGGLSSSIGEMAEDTNGCLVDLAQAPLKYDGLRPWEILLSEAQERMTLAVPPASLETFLDLAKRMDVEATPLGTFTDSGKFHVTCGDKLVTWLDMSFMHNGVPQLELDAEWTRPVFADTRITDEGRDQAALIKTMLGRLNICSKEYLIRQYD